MDKCIDSVLEKIHSPRDLKSLSMEDLQGLAREIREFLIANVPQTGGHFASNLGNVELTVALHHVFDSPRDAIVWDVSHGCYPHKLLTGRRASFSTLRQDGGISGFLNPTESEHDWASTGHAGTGLSTAMGIAWARKHLPNPGHVTVLVGDASLPTGLSQEALNNLSSLGARMTILLNDNQWSIDPTPGALADVLRRHREDGAARGFFENYGLDYVGPVDGHDLPGLVKVFDDVKSRPHPTVVHLVTCKGKGYEPAEKDAGKFHALKPPANAPAGEAAATFSSVFATTLADMAERDSRIVAVSAGMLGGTGLDLFKQVHPDRCFDVGIAEQHAVTFAAGLTLEGFRPVVGIYSTFLQRAYDQIAHDVCLPGLPVIFAVDRAGVVGADGPTHHGTFDLAYLRHLPNMKILAPSSAPELRRQLEEAFRSGGPIAIRYPRETVVAERDHAVRTHPIIGGSRTLRAGDDAALLVVGAMVPVAIEAAELLAARGMELEVVEAPSIKPLDEARIVELAERHSVLVTLEDHTVIGGFGSSVAELLSDRGSAKLTILGWPDAFLEHGSVDALRKKWGLDAEGVVGRIERLVRESRGGTRDLAEYASVGTDAARALMAEIQEVELSGVIREAENEYAKVGSRDAFLWKWVRHGVDITTLSSVDDGLREHVCDTKTLGVFLDVLIDDVADSHSSPDFMERLISICEGSAPSLSGLSELRRGYLEFTESIWHRIQSRCRSYPRYEEFHKLLAFDYRQLMNVMRYSFLINRQPALINLTEHDLYMPHNMHMMVSGTMDLMVSPDVDRRDLGPLREVLWHAQEMGRIGNVVTTWEREIREGDLSSGVFAVGRAEGVLDLEDFRREHPRRLAGKIRSGDLESRFLERWNQLREKILRKSVEIRTIDVSRIVAGLDRLLRLHLSSRGLK